MPRSDFRVVIVATSEADKPTIDVWRRLTAMLLSIEKRQQAQGDYTTIDTLREISAKYYGDAESGVEKVRLMSEVQSLSEFVNVHNGGYFRPCRMQGHESQRWSVCYMDGNSTEISVVTAIYYPTYTEAQEHADRLNQGAASERAIRWACQTLARAR